MAFSLVALAAVVALGVIVWIVAASSRGGSRALPIVIGLALLVVVGGGGVLLFGYRAVPRTTTVVTGPVQVVAAPANPATAPETSESVKRALRGRVLRGSEGEVAVPGAAVDVFPAGTGCVAFHTAVAAVSTEPDGRFAFDAVPGAAHRVRAAAPGLASAVVPAPDGDAADVTIRLQPGTFLAGRVLDAETKAPVAGARVSVGDATGAVAATDGAFRIEGTPRGAVQVAASAPGYARRSDSVDLPEWGRTGYEILLRAGGSVAGIVLGPDGKPAAGATVSATAVIKVPVVGETPVPLDAEPAAS
ncbi:MAG TPA: carboxypeptidase regulatory-like domain-containing protein, partial [Planctomycetota bacterium]|nr:carboxypeptidase regulatory-like domain-containing protein [Planctomycetota bacterium]